MCTFYMKLSVQLYVFDQRKDAVNYYGFIDMSYCDTVQGASRPTWHSGITDFDDETNCQSLIDIMQFQTDGSEILG